MKTNNPTFFKEAVHKSAGKIFAAITVVSVIWGFVANLIPNKWAWYILLGGLIVLIVYSTVLISIQLRRIKSGILEEKIREGRSVTVIRNGYEENLDFLLRTLPREELKRFVFISGIDICADLSVNTKNGTTYCILHYLDRGYRCTDNSVPSEETQRQLDAYRKGRKLDYGETVFINLRLLSKTETEPEETYCNIMFVANSRKENYDNPQMFESLKEDGQSPVIVPSIFNNLDKAKDYTGAMIGIIGSRSLYQPFPVVYSQIINQFARISYQEGAGPFKLYVSIREEDYIRWNCSLSQLAEYVRECIKLYRKSDSK